jgi:streptogramin lyase
MIRTAAIITALALLAAPAPLAAASPAQRAEAVAACRAEIVRANPGVAAEAVRLEGARTRATRTVVTMSVGERQFTCTVARDGSVTLAQD